MEHHLETFADFASLAFGLCILVAVGMLFASSV